MTNAARMLVTRQLLEPLRALEALGRAHRTAAPLAPIATASVGRAPRAGRREDPRSLVQRLESAPLLPPGDRERFNGFVIMGLPFASGHVLAMRRMPASSVGPGYASVWHRDPGGAWTFYADESPRLSCTRYFGVAAARAIETRILISWPEAYRLRIEVPAARLEWDVELESNWATSLLNATARLLPQAAWRSRAALDAMSVVAGALLGTGRIRLRGVVPNGQNFIANPRALWSIRASRASWDGLDLGPPGPLSPQVRLAGFWIPQRGVFALGQTYFDPFDPSRHSSATAAAGAGESVSIEP